MKKDARYARLRLVCFFKISTIVFVLFPFWSNAQADAEKGLPFITNYSPKSYKALPQTWAVIEDNRGIMYFGVQNGILEYDGVKWRKVAFKKPIAIAWVMTKDKKGRIYYGAIGDFGYLDHDSLGQTVGFSLLDYVPKEFRNFFDVWTIHVADEGIYFQSREAIFRLNEKNEVKVWKPETNFMYAFYLDHKYYVHERTRGLFQLNSDSLQLIAGSEFLGQERMQVMLPYRSSNRTDAQRDQQQYLVGLFYSGLYLYDGKTFKPFNTEASQILKTGTLYKGIQSPDGHYVLSTTGKGVAIIDGAGKIIKRINRDIGLQDESLYAVFFDSKGTLWLGLDNGISRVETSSPLSQLNNQSGVNTSALSLARFEGKLYLGTTNGLMRFNPTSAKFEKVEGVPGGQTFGLVPDSNKLFITNDGLFAIRDNKVEVVQASVGGDMAVQGLLRSPKYRHILYVGSNFGVKVFTITGNSVRLVGSVPH